MRSGSGGGDARQRDRVTDRNGVLADPHFAHEQAHDPLAFSDAKRLGRLAHALEESLHRGCKGQLGLPVQSGGLQRIEFGDDGALSGLQRGVSFA